MPSLSSVQIDPFVIARLFSRDALQRILNVVRFALLLIIVALVAWVVREGLSTFLTVESDLRSLENASVNPVDVSSSKKTTEYRNADYAIIAKAAVFGTLTEKAAAPATDAKPVSNLALNLIGTFIATDSPPYAIIEDDKKKIQDVFNLKDMIFNEAKLVAIYPDRVEIERNGKIEVLRLDDTNASDKGTASNGGIAEVGTDEFVVEEGELNQALENLPLLLTQARAVPYFKDGRSIGLRLFAIRSGSIFEKIGLKNGDILKSVNGQSLADLTQAVKLFEKLRDERSVSVVLERDRGDREFKYQIR